MEQKTPLTEIGKVKEQVPQPLDERKPPAPGAPQRDAVASVIDGVARDICNDIAEMHRLLERLQQQILEGAADVKHQLTEQIAICGNFKTEVRNLQDIVNEIAERDRAARTR